MGLEPTQGHNPVIDETVIDQSGRRFGVARRGGLFGVDPQRGQEAPFESTKESSACHLFRGRVEVARQNKRHARMLEVPTYLLEGDDMFVILSRAQVNTYNCEVRFFGAYDDGSPVQPTAWDVGGATWVVG